MNQLSDDFLKVTCHQPLPQRAHVARASAIFDFLPSPFGDKKLWNNGLSVKASPDLPSPVKAEKGQFLHPQITNCQAVGSEGEG
jgi:hypothetical protein